MKTLHLLLAAGMLITGSVNTISTKAADQATTVNRYGESVSFNHPFFQALCMFLGESLCLIVFFASRARAKATGAKFDEAKAFSPLILLLPALCDMTGTSLMYVGLSLTNASIFQMLRGSVVIFTGIASVLFLKDKQKDGSTKPRRLAAYQWLGMLFVLAGTAAVGTTSIVCPASGAAAAADASKALLGNSLIIFAQVLVAVQMVVEETFIAGYEIPALQVVGFEGVWGIAALSVVLTIMYFVPAPTAFCLYPAAGAYPAHCDHFEDAYDALVQMSRNWVVGVMLVLNIFSIAFFNVR
jgi:drug/metabolite transporter (DMT)-like permease